LWLYQRIERPGHPATPPAARVGSDIRNLRPMALLGNALR